MAKKLAAFIIIFALGVLAALYLPPVYHQLAGRMAGHHSSGDNHNDQAKSDYQTMHDAHHGGQSGMMQSGMMHDETTMPGLVGRDTSTDEVADMARMFNEHQGISRRVENLPNGIRTVTEADDETLREAIVNHVASMTARLDEGRDPQVPIQSPTLALLFAGRDRIITELEPTDKGIAVIQTSEDPALVAALQTHAGEVSDMAARGMAPVHERMAASGDDHHGHSEAHR